MATLATGTGRTLVQKGTIQRLLAIERRQPPGTRLYLQSRWTVVHLPVVGAVHTGAIAASVVNQAYSTGKLVSGGHAMPLWPGDTKPASYNASTRTLTVRWRTASAYVDLIIAALAGITVGAIAAFLKVPPSVAIQIGLGVALAVGSMFVVSYLESWFFGTPATGTPGRINTLLTAALVGAAVLVPVFVVAGGRRR